MTKIAVVGTGKLGFPIALSMATKHDVVGYDVSPAAKEILASKKYPHREVKAQEYLDQTTMRMVDTIDEAVAHADIVFVIVQTPHRPEFEGVTRLTDDRADFDYTFLKGAVADVARAAEAQKKSIILSVMSTVLPGTVDREIRPLLNQWTMLVYNPAFPAMGSAIDDYENPEFVLLGVDTQTAADKVRAFYGTITTAPVVEMSIASAEATKVFYNSFITAKIGLANAWMEICHRLGANVDDVTKALSLATSRVISTKYLKGGLGDAGGCFIEGELIHTEGGVCAIDEIEKGDRVLGGDGKFHEVLEAYRRPYKGRVYTIKGRGLLRFTVTGEHPLYVSRDLRPVLSNGRREQLNGPQLGAVEQIRAADLTDDYYIVFPTPTATSEREMWSPPRANFGPEPRAIYVEDSETYALLAGYYMAEGNIWFNKNKNYLPTRVNFAFNTETDSDYIAECVECLRKIAPTSHVTVKTKNARESCTEVRVNSAQLAKVLDHDFGHGYEDKYVPAWILNSHRYSALCLRSLFRGDGSSHDEGLSFSTVSPHLAHGVSLMLRRHGIPSTQQYHPKRVGADGVVHRPAYDLGVSNAVHIPKLAEIVGMPIRHKMQDKLYPNVIFERDGLWYHYVHSIEQSDYEGTVYNLNVAEVHNYVSVGGLVANCHPRDGIALSWLSRKLEMTYDLFGDLMRIREAQTDWLARLCIEEAKRTGLPIVILGKAYKKGTGLTVGSCATLLKNVINEYAWVKAGHAVDQWDPHVDGERAFTSPALFVIATDHDEFYSMSLPADSVVIDPWGKWTKTGAVMSILVGRNS